MDRPGRGIFAVCAVAALVLLFGVLAAVGVADKSATYDENVHAPAGITYLQLRDYRINPEHPVLWKYWAALPNLGRHYEIGPGQEDWDAVPGELSRQWDWATLSMYRTPANNPGLILQRSRWMMILLAVPLAVLIAAWARTLGGAKYGAAAGIIAVFVFALDPNFLAHGPLVTNDVPFAMMMLLCTWCAWRAGDQLTWGRLAALLLAVGATINTKYSGVFLGPILILLLLIRAMLPQPWPVLRWKAAGRGQRLLVVVGLGLAMAAATWAITWAAYGFRYRTADGIAMKFERMLDIERGSRFVSDHPKWRTMTREQFDAWDRAYKPGLPARACVWMRDRRLLPEPFLFGVLHVYANSLLRKMYLLGQVREHGWWYYFPLAMLFKTPVATLCAGVAAVCVAAAGMERRERTQDKETQRQGDKERKEKNIQQPTSRIQHRMTDNVGAPAPCLPVSLSPCLLWSAICLILPPALYLGQIMSAHFNLGLRHALPIYPFVFIGLGLALARLWSVGRVAGRVLVLLLGLGLAAETLAALPNFIPFFNAPSVVLAGGNGKLELLGDSNLDWGQDLPALAEWQKAHPDNELYLCYFGPADPAWYGVKYHNLPFGYSYGPKEEFPPGPGVIAISASKLQGIYLDRGSLEGQFLMNFRKTEPIAILGGGSIYLYRWR